MPDISWELVARMALEKHGFRFTHSLGQNFLLNQPIITRIADTAKVGAGVNILEIGAGAGVLTAEMAGRGAKVWALEIDRALEPVLAEVLKDLPSARVIFEDALKCDLESLTRDAFGGAPFQVVANLPYYITSDILLKLASSGLPLESITVMVQKEACERMIAGPGQKQYSALAATLAYYGALEALFEVPPSAFTPPPHVHSVLMRVRLYSVKPVQARSDEKMRATIDAAFAMRRKTLLNNLTAAFSLPRAQAEDILRRCGLDPRVRGEALSLAELARVADALTP